MRSRLMLGLLVGMLCGGAVWADSNAVYFIQITDTHFGVADHNSRTERLVAEINRLPMPIACVVHTGDLFTDNMHKPDKVREGMAVLDKLDPPLYSLAGNHDILKGHTAPTLAAFTNSVAPLAYTVETQGMVFAMVYTENIAVGVEIDGYDPLGWLAGTLEAAGDKPVIVCHHRPSARDFYRNRMHDKWDPDGLVEWERVLKSSPNVLAVLAGHFHRDELHWIGDIPVHVAASVAGYWGRQGSYRIYEYKDGKLGYRTRYLE